MYKIYIVEDDATIARTLKEHLEKWDYQVQCAKDFRNITEEFARFSPELVLMDILLPFYNGYHWCTQIRKISRVPILFLSSAARSWQYFSCLFWEPSSMWRLPSV